MNLAIICTHPIQYNVPMFRLLAAVPGINLKVFYTWEKKAAAFDKGFGRVIEWDIPLLDGYQYEFVSNQGNMGRGFFDVKNRELEKSLHAFSPAAVLIYGWNYWSHLRAMLYWKKKALVLFRGDSTLLGERKGLKRSLRRLFLTWLYSYIDSALYAGTRNKEYFLKHGLKKSQLIFAPHAIDNNRFADPSHDTAAAAWKSELNLPGRGTTFLYAGKLDDNKDVPLLINAFLELNNENNALIIIGNGKMEPEISALTSGMGNIKWLPFQNQSKMPLVYRLADVFVLPSKGPIETWGLAVNEAMASGCAIIVSSIVGCGIDLVKPGTNGYIFTAGDKESLKNCMRETNTRNISSLKKASVEIIRHWTYQKQIDSLLAFLNSRLSNDKELISALSVKK